MKTAANSESRAGSCIHDSGQAGGPGGGSPAGSSRTALYFVLIFVLLAAGIVGTGYLYYRHSEKNYRVGVEHQLAAVADLKVGELAHWREDRLTDGAIFFKNPSFSALVRRLFEKPADADAQRQLQDWLGKYPTLDDYNQVRLLDAQGVTRLSIPGSLPPATAITVLAAAEAVRSGRIIIEDFYRHERDQRVYLSVQIPLFDDRDASRPLGALVLRIDPTTYLYPFIKRWPAPSLTAETLLLRRDGNDALYLNDLRHRSEAALALRIPLEKSEVPAARAALEQTGIVQGPDYRGVPVIAALRAVPDSPWFMVAKIDAAEVSAPLSSHLRQLVFVIGALLFGAGACVGLVWRQQLIGFYREQVETAEALWVEKVNLDALFESSPVAMFILDETTNIVRVNAAAVLLSGGSVADVLQHRPGNALRCVHSSQDQRGCGYSPDCKLCPVRNGLEALIASGGTIHEAELELELVRDEAPRKVWLSIGAEPVQINDRRHLCVAMEDISARKQAEAALHHLNAELEQRVQERTAQLEAANRELEAFSYSVSHDLRAPLRAIDGFSGMVIEDYGGTLDAEGQRLLGVVRNNAKKMSQLIDDLLSFSRTGRGELKHERLDMAALARSVFDEIGGDAAARARIDFTVEELPEAEGDAALVRQVWVNLLSNAVKYSSRKERAVIEVAGAREGDQVVYQVRDNGAGFDMHCADKLFGVFQRLHGAEEFDGTGIGLANVRRIVSRHGGRTWAEGAVDRGAIFHFTLRPAAARVAVASASPRHPG